MEGGHGKLILLASFKWQYLCNQVLMAHLDMWLASSWAKTSYCISI